MFNFIRSVLGMKARKRIKSIPQDDWEQMPDFLKDMLKAAEKGGAVINYAPGSSYVEVIRGLWAARGYNTKTGQCVSMS
jgi:hypothetical protein